LRLLNNQGQTSKKKGKKKGHPSLTAADVPTQTLPAPMEGKTARTPVGSPLVASGFMLCRLGTVLGTVPPPIIFGVTVCGPGPQKYSIQEKKHKPHFECKMLERQGSVSIISMYKLVWNSHPVFSVPKQQAQALHSALQ
jgi:hypothetical protein